MKPSAICIAGSIVILALFVGCKPALTKQSARKVIPDGMSEARGYETLGTNGSVTVGQHGEKIVWYFFRFTGLPPKVETKIDTMGVVLSNGFVIGRRFASP
jgi:hypothetical protein